MNLKVRCASFVPGTVLLLLSGCAGITPQSTWQAAVSAAHEPATWAPLAGAAFLSLGDMDENLSDWAAHKNPLFGSIEDADSTSDDLRRVSTATMVLSTLITPDNHSDQGWLYQKGTRIAVEGIGFGLATTTTNALKDASNRTRPNKQSNNSLPSLHATDAFVSARFSATNISRLNLEPSNRALLKVGVYTLATGTAWARVEAERHFVTDVLVGASVGNFFAAFTENLFDPLLPTGISISPQLSADRFAIGLNIALD